MKIDLSSVCTHNITSEIIDQLKEFRSPISLDLSYTNLFNAGIKRLVEEVEILTELHIWNCTNITGEEIDWSKARKLTKANFCASRLTNKGLKAIIESVENLTELEVTNCEKITGEGIDWSKAKNLKKLDVTDSGFTASTKNIEQATPGITLIQIHL